MPRAYKEPPLSLFLDDDHLPSPLTLNCSPPPYLCLMPDSMPRPGRQSTHGHVQIRVVGRQPLTPPTVLKARWFSSAVVHSGTCIALPCALWLCNSSLACLGNRSSIVSTTSRSGTTTFRDHRLPRRPSPLPPAAIFPKALPQRCASTEHRSWHGPRHNHYLKPPPTLFMTLWSELTASLRACLRLGSENSLLLATILDLASTVAHARCRPPLLSSTP